MDGASSDPRQTRGLGRYAVGFAVGIVTGVILAIAGLAVAVSDEDMDKLRETLIYLTSALAVDTERNAKKIVILEERIEDLEAQLAEMARRAK